MSVTPETEETDMPTGLLKRVGRYSTRRIIPLDLQAHYGWREIVKALGTSNFADAKRLHARMNVTLDDGTLLLRPTSEIYDKSYVRVMDDRGNGPALPKDQFYQRLNSLKKPTHGSILVGNRQGWYGFRENIVRGYVRLRAERAGVQIGVDHITG